LNIAANAQNVFHQLSRRPTFSASF